MRISSPCWNAATGCSAVAPLNQLNTCPTIGSPSKTGKLEKLLELELELIGGKIIGALELDNTTSLKLEPKLGSLPAELINNSLELVGTGNAKLLLEPNSGSIKLELVGINGALEADPNDSLVGKLGTLLTLLVLLKLEVLEGIGKGKGIEELLELDVEGKKKPSSVMMY